jgi:calcineurin-like phosphoesterase family protein
MLNQQNFAPERYEFFYTQNMNQKIIEAWNLVVSANDTVYHLGDIGVFYKNGSKEEMLDILNSLNGNIIFIKGNHDSRDFFKFLAQNNYQSENKQVKFAFEDIGAYFKYNHRQFYLTHYPMLFGVSKNIINLHGHVHHYSINQKENINVGIDSADFDYFFTNDKPTFGSPLSMSQIEFLIKAKRDDFNKRK